MEFLVRFEVKVPPELDGEKYEAIMAEEKRRGVEDLGSVMIGQLSYYERWIISAINVLLEKQILTPDDLARKTAEVSARYASASATGAA